MLENIDDLKKDLQEYIEIKVDLVRLHVAENISHILTTTANVTIIGYLSFFILLFLSLAAGFLLATILNSYILGFLGLSVFYMLLLILFLLLRKQIIERPIIRSITQLFFPKFGDDEKL